MEAHMNSALLNGVCMQRDHLHVQCTLGLGCFLSGAVANQSAALGQAEVKGQQGAMLHADSPQGGAINLEGRERLT